MPAKNAEVVGFETGKFICPNTKQAVPLVTPCPLTAVEWPVVVECCPGCKQRHVLHSEEVLHPPVFGYE